MDFNVPLFKIPIPHVNPLHNLEQKQNNEFRALKSRHWKVKSGTNSDRIPRRSEFNSGSYSSRSDASQTSMLSARAELKKFLLKTGERNPEASPR